MKKEKDDMSKEETDKIVTVSYLRHRRILGILGMALPVILAVWGFALSGWSLELQGSLSDYYALRTGDVFVGILVAIALFLCAYKGYEDKDDIAGYLACLFALGVAFFPSTGESWEKTVHFLSATGLFLVLSFFSLILFTKTKKEEEAPWWRRILDAFRCGSAGPDDKRTTQKRRRNRVYVACGLAMLVFMIFIGLYYWLWEDTAVADIKPVFWLESLMLWAFGVSWIVKGDWLWLSSDHKGSSGKTK